ETCDGDPRAEIERLRADGFEVRINILGFAVDDAALADDFSQWAALSGGVYLEAEDAASFDQAMADSLRPVYRVRDADGAVVASPFPGDPPLELPAGAYTVDLRDGVNAFAITTGQTTVLTVP
ncbi:MAG: hypothetical protein ACFCVH_15030, partial [Alphaproteobacteria bacterium]